LPFIKCDVYLLNSYYKIVENDEHVFALKGDIKVTWTRFKITHPEVYKRDKSLFPMGKNQSAYDV